MSHQRLLLGFVAIAIAVLVVAVLGCGATTLDTLERTAINQPNIPQENGQEVDLRITLPIQCLPGLNKLESKPFSTRTWRASASFPPLNSQNPQQTSLDTFGTLESNQIHILRAWGGDTAFSSLLFVKETKVSLALHSSANDLTRLERALMTVRRWKGPVSLAALVCSTKDVENLEEWKAKADKEELQVFVSVIVPPRQWTDYPTNLVRNVALSGIPRSIERVVLLDADAWLSSSQQEVAEQVHNWDLDIIGVIPAFEFVGPLPSQFEQEVCVDPDSVTTTTKAFTNNDAFPTSKSTLTSLLDAGYVRVMHAPRPSYSLPDDEILKWARKPNNEGMNLEYSLMFEPYAVFPLSLVSDLIMFDERFVGRGFNKQSFFFELWATGVKFRALPNTFVVDLPNPMNYEGPMEISQTNKDLWKQFRYQVHARYGLECDENAWYRCDENWRARLCGRNICRRFDRSRNNFVGGNKRSPTEKPISHQKSYQAAVPLEQEIQQDWLNFVQEMEISIPMKKSRAMSAEEREACVGSKVDVVYTWVNGSDPNHRSERARYIPETSLYGTITVDRKRRLVDHNLEFRFRDLGEGASTLQNSIASVRKNLGNQLGMIWIVIADEQDPPSFLSKNFALEGIHIVRHSTIFSKASECLPTFHSCAIETQLHRIPGLSSCYFYLNDDILLIRPLDVASRYWPLSELAPRIVMDGGLAPRIGRDDWQRKIANLAQELQLELNIPWTRIFTTGHHGHFFVKRLVEEVEKRFKGRFDETQCERYRGPTSVWVPMFYSNYAATVLPSRALRETSKYHALLDGGATKTRTLLRELRNKIAVVKENPVNDGDADPPPWLCLNDVMGREADEVVVQVLREELNAFFAG